VEFEYRPEAERETFIRANLPLGVVATVPEVVLHRAYASSGLHRLADLQGAEFGSPYWAYPWAGGLALARYLLDRPEIASRRRVLDMGAGGGIVAIAAAKAGAAQVTAVDTDPNAIAALGLNAAANGVTIRTILGDLTTIGPLPDTDLVTVGDLFYERMLAERVTGFLDRCLAAGAEVLVGDPGRAFLPTTRLRKLADYPVSDVGDGQDIAVRTSTVFAFEAA
jgi:predicted nicotinamide N-methyase